MASNKKAPYTARCKVWLPTFSMEVSGGLSGSIETMFRCLPKHSRALLLSSLHVIDTEMREMEAAEGESET